MFLMRDEALSNDVVAVVRDVLQTEMRLFGVTRVEAVVAPDHDGDLSIAVDVNYSDEGLPLDPKVMVGLLSKLRDRLSEEGEQRFPYIRHHVPANRDVIGVK